MKNYSAAAISFVLLAAVASLSAQQTASVTLDEAIQIGLQKSRALHSSQMNVQYAESKSSEANALLLPSVKFNGAYTRLSDVPASEISIPFLPQPITLSPSVLNNYNLKLTVQQPLFTGFKLQSNADIADYTAKATQKDYKKDKNDLIFNIKNTYWSLSQAIAMQTVVDENVEQMKEHLKEVQAWLEQGMITTNEVLKVQVQLSDATLRQIDMRNNVQLTRIGFNNLLGLPLDTELQPVTTLKREPRKFGDLSVLLRQAREQRPELKSMALKVKAGNAVVSIAQSNWYPQIYLVGNYYSSRPNQRFFPTQDAFKETWDVGVAMSFDVWNWDATVHQTEQAKAQLSQAEDGLAQLKDAVTLDVTRNYLNLRRAKERMVVAEQGVNQAEENYRVVNEKFKQGSSLNTDLLDAEVALLQAKTNYTQSLVDFELAEAGLERAIGE
jgi:outer membrane protein TolC